jgi:hypothetical protein
MRVALQRHLATSSHLIADHPLALQSNNLPTQTGKGTPHIVTAVASSSCDACRQILLLAGVLGEVLLPGGNSRLRRARPVAADAPVCLMYTFLRAMQSFCMADEK